MFFGRYYHAIDSKGRVSVPAQFRDGLLGDPRLMLAPYVVFGQPCLDVYSPAQWQALLEKFSTRPKFSVQAQRFEMGYLSRSYQCEIDAAGRVLVPPELREYAGLKKDVVFLGMNQRIRLMDREKVLKVDGEIAAEAAETAAMYEDLDL